MRVLVTLLLLVSFLSADYIGEEGAMEFGGYFGYSNWSNNDAADTRGHQWEITPLFNWFLVDNIYVGPRLHLESTNDMTIFGVGGAAGYAFLPTADIIPFAELGLEFLYSEYADAGGLAIPIYGGVKLPVGDQVLVGFSMGTNIKFINDNPGADFGFNFGITFCP